MATYTPFTLIPHPDVEGKYTLVSSDGETLGGTYNADGTAFKDQRAPWDDSGTVAPYDDGSKNPDIDPKEYTPANIVEEDSFYDDFNLASWYARILKGDTFDADLQTKKDYAFSNFDPNRGELAGTNSDGWAMDELLGLPFVDHIREGGISNSISLSSPFEVDYDYGYDNQNLYMKLPETGGSNSMIQGFSDEERAQYQDLMDRGRFIDSSDGNAGPGEYTMIWIEDPPEASAWSQFLSNPVVNLMAAIIPGGAQVIATLKAVSGETMHASDWFAYAGGYDVVGKEFGEFAANMGEVASAAVGGSEFLAKAVTAGTKNAIAALITDQDPLEAFLTGGVQVAVGRILGEVNKLTGGALDSLEEIGVFTDDTRVYGDDGKGGKKLISGSESQSVGKIARSMIQEAVASQLATGDINKARMAQIVSSAVITTDTLKGFVGERLPSGGIQMIATSLQSSLNAAILGGDVSDAFLNSLAAQIERSVRQSLNNGTFGEDFAEFWDRASGTYGILTEQALVADEAATARAEAAKEVNEVNNLINDGAEKLTALSKTVNDAKDAMGGGYGAGATIEEMDAYEAALAAYEDYEAEFTDALNNDYIPRIDSGTETYNKATDDYNTAADLYQSTYDGLSDGGDDYDSGFADALANINEATVKNLSPNFDPEFYAEQNGITVEEANAHYLSTGLANNLPPNQTGLTAKNNTQASNLLDTVAELTGIDVSALSPAERKAIVDRYKSIAASEGVSVSDLDVGSAIGETLDTLSGSGSSTFSVTSDADGNITGFEYSHVSGSTPLAEGVTAADVVSGAAKMTYDASTGSYEWAIPPDGAYVADGDLYIQDEETGEYYRIDEETKERVYPETIGDSLAPKQGQSPKGDSLTTLEDMSNPDSPAYNPEQFTQEVNDNNLTDGLTDDSGSWAGNAAQWLLDALNNGAVYFENTDTGVWEIEKESFTHPQNLYSLFAQSMAQIPEAIGGIADKVSGEYGGAVTQFAKDMSTIAEGARTQEYADAIQRSNEFAASLPPATDDPNTPIELYTEDVRDRDGNIRHRKGDYKSGDESRGSSAFFHGMKNVLQTAFDSPGVFFSQTVIPEVPVEFVNIVVGQKIKLGTRAILDGVRSVKKLGLTDNLVESLSSGMGLAGSALMDVGESAGATFTGTYEQAFDTKVKMLGLEADNMGLKGEDKQNYIDSFNDQTTEYALTLATNAFYLAGLTTAALMAAGGMELDKLFINGKVPDNYASAWTKALDWAKTRPKAVTGETVSEGFEEGVIADYVSGELHLIDPSINVSQETGAAVALGMMAAFGVTVQMVAAQTGVDIVNSVGTGSFMALASNPTALGTIVSVLNSGLTISPEELQDAMDDAFNGSTAVVADVMNIVYDSAYTSSVEATDILTNSGLTFTPEDVAALMVDVDGRYVSDDNIDKQLATYMATTYGTDNDTDGDGIPNLQDNDPNNPDISNIQYDINTGESTYVNEDGNIVVVGSDGTEEVFDQNGNSIDDSDNVVTNDDGSVTTTNTDGSSSTVDADGNLISSTDVNGDTTAINADGGSTTTDADGNLISSTNVNGDTTTYNDDGTYSIADINGDTTNYNADGTVVTSGNTDNVVTNDDGSVTTTNTDGSSSTVDADGNLISSTDVNGDTTTYNDDGTYSIAGINGDTTNYNADGTQIDPVVSYTAGEYVDPDGDGVYQLVGEDGKTLTGKFNEDGTAYVDPVDEKGTNADVIQDMLDDTIGTPATDSDPATGLYAELEQLGLNDQQILTFIGTPASIDAEGNVIPATGLYNEITNVNGNVTASKEEVLSAIGNPSTDTDAATGVFAAIDTQTGVITGEIAATQKAITDQALEFEIAGMARDAAIQAAIDQVGVDLGLTKEQILAQINLTEANLNAQIGLGIDQLSGEIAAAQKAITDQALEFELLGIKRDEAIRLAVNKVGIDLGLTREEILNQVNLTEANLNAQIGLGIDQLSAEIDEQTGEITRAISSTEKAITKQAAEIESKGIARDVAIQSAIDKVGVDLGLTKEQILAQIGLTEENLATQIGLGVDQITGDLDLIAQYLGKPAREVTTQDALAVADIIAEQAALPDPTSFVATDQQLQYDVNNDGVIDINDQILLEQSLSGVDVNLEGAFDNTGLYAYNDAIATQQKREQETIAAQEQQLAQERQLQFQTQLDTTQRRSGFDREIRDVASLQAAQPTVVSTNKMGLADIGPAYNFDSIFRDRAQDQFYNTPFGGYGSDMFGVTKAAKGGKIENDTDKLIRIIGE